VAKKNNAKEGISKAECIKELQLLQSKFPEKNMTRGFFRGNSEFKDSVWEKYFGNFTEFKQVAGLELSKQQKIIKNSVSKHSSTDHYKDFYKDKIFPWHNKYDIQESKNKDIKVLMIASDLHDIHVDRFALSVFIDQCSRIQPDHIILAGDIYDMPEFSYWAKDPREFKIKERFDFVRQHIFGALRNVCPKSQIDLVIGNHEYRLLRVLADATPNLKVLLSDVMGITLEDMFMLKEHKINLIAKLNLHTFSKQEGKSEVESNYKIYYDCFVVTHKKDYGFGLSGCNGHHHRLEMTTHRNIPSKQYSWVQMGGMHELDAEYYEGLNTWNLGYNQVTINTKEKTVLQVPRMIHEDWAMVNGVYYAKK